VDPGGNTFSKSSLTSERGNKEISSMTPLAPIATISAPSFPGFATATAATDTDAKSFSQTLSDALDSLNSLQVTSGDMAVAYANHQTSDLHSVMIASEQASIALQLATQVRNKLVDAYQEIEKLSV
jgi:flagellar hook-basal body complex protein FliE